jgi:DNA-binding GntR family transcriptional regulator
MALAWDGSVSRAHSNNLAQSSALTGGRQPGAATVVAAGLQFKSKAQVVYELLRGRILDSQYVPGQALSIDGLARELGVSKIPIREAIKQLEAEHLVETVLHVGARVASISLELAGHIYPIRHALANLATSLAVARITDAEIEQLERLHQAMQAALDADDPRRIEPLNRDFHQVIAVASGNPPLAELHRDLMARCSRFRAGVPLQRERAVSVIREHAEILTALRARDAERCLAITIAHGDGTAKDVMDRLRALERVPGRDEGE